MKVEVDGLACCLSGDCALAAPAVFKVQDDELIYDAAPSESEREAVEEAAAICPTQAIAVTTEA